jgi:hypothetical protein
MKNMFLRVGAILVSCVGGYLLYNIVSPTVKLDANDLNKNNQPLLDTSLKLQGKKYTTGNAVGRIGEFSENKLGDALSSFAKQQINDNKEYRGTIYGISDIDGELVEIATYIAIVYKDNRFKAILNQTVPLYSGQETALYVMDGEGKRLLGIPFNSPYKGYWGGYTPTGTLRQAVYNKPDAIKAKLFTDKLFD